MDQIYNSTIQLPTLNMVGGCRTRTNARAFVPKLFW